METDPYNTAVNEKMITVSIYMICNDAAPHSGIHF